MRSIQTTLIFWAATILTTGAALGQSNASDAALEGFVRDSSGSSVPSAQITARCVETNVIERAVADSNGYYRFPLLPVGTYEIGVSAAGFRDYKQAGLALTVGLKAHVDATLQVGAASETISVTADASLADTGSAASGGILDQKEVNDLPAVSRNIYNLFLQEPGILGIPLDHIRTTYFTFGGGERANWTVDGLDDSEHSVNRQIRLVVVMPDAVQEMQVLGSGYSAEFGGAAGGQVNLVLKSGTNDFHGSVMYLDRPNPWQARPTLSATNPPNRSWWDTDATLGGPIVKDRLFFFGQVEVNPYVLPKAITVTPANETALHLAPSDLGPAPYGEDYHALLAKIDYRIDDNNFGFLRANRFTNSQPNTASGLTVPSRGNTYFDSENAGAFQLATIFNPKLLNELRIGVIERDSGNGLLPGTPADAAYINITGVANFGQDPLSANYTVEQTEQITDNLTRTSGRHTWKAGIDYEHTGFEVLKAENRAFVFGGVAAANGYPAVSPLNQYLDTLAGSINPITGKPYTYTQFQEDGGNPRLNIGFNLLKGFLQDEIRVTPQLTINAGVRYEVIYFPEFDPNAPYPLSRSVNNDTHDFAPRFGITWAPGSNRRTVISAAWGTYYDVPDLGLFYGAAQVNGDRFLSYQVAGTSPEAPVFPNVPVISDPSFLVKPSITAFAPGFKDAYQEQTTVQIRHEAPLGVLITVGYNLELMRHGLYEINVNTGAPIGYLADGRPIFGATHPNPNFNQINTIESGGTGNYNAGYVSIERRFSRGLELGVSYVYSHALSDTLGEGGAPEDPTDLRRDYGNSDTDERHNLVMHAIFEPRFGAHLQWLNGLRFSTAAYYNSGLPINVVTGTDLNGDGNLNDRPLFVGRNSVGGPSFLQVDQRVERTFTFHESYHASVLAEFENLLNSTNPGCATNTGCTSAVINTAGAADFGRLTTAAISRNIQIGARFQF